MAQLIQFKLIGKLNQFDMYCYSGLTGANAQTAIKVDKDAEGNINLDLTGKVATSGTGTTAQLWLVIRATTGSELEFVNALLEPDFGGRYWEIRTNSQAPGGTELRISSVVRWADGSPTPANRYTTTVGSTGPGPAKPDAFIKFRMNADANQVGVSYSGALTGAGAKPVTLNADTSLNLKDMVEAEGGTNRRLPFVIAPKSGYQIDQVTVVPVGPFNEYLGKLAWTWDASGVNHTTDVVNTMGVPVLADAVQYVTTVESSLIPVPAQNINIAFAGEKSHFDVVYTGGTTGSSLKPVPTDGVFTLDLVGKVGTGISDKYLQFRIVPREGCTVLSASASPTPPVNPVLGRRSWVWGKGSLPYLSTEITIESANETTFTMTVVSTGPTPDVQSPFNKLFNLTRSKMEDLSNKMLGVWGASDDGAPANSGFLINLMILPFKLPTQVLGDEQAIKIGSYNTSVLAPVVEDDSIDIDLGTISVDGLFGSSLDYQAAQYELTLPFFGSSIELAPSDVVGKVINARYDLDAYTGMATVNVFNDGSGVPIASATDKVARAIPFKMFSEIENKLDEAIQTNNGLMRAYIRVTRQEVVTGEYGSMVKVSGVIGVLPGYIEVDNLELRGVPDSDRVKALLRAGVIVK